MLGGVDSAPGRSCSRCRGTGGSSQRPCTRCEGTGQEPAGILLSADCPSCDRGILFVRAIAADGKRTATSVCAECGGTSYVTHDGAAVTSVAKGAA